MEAEIKSSVRIVADLDTGGLQSMSKEQSNGIIIENELNYYLSMKVLNEIKKCIPNKEYKKMKEWLIQKYNPVFALASEILLIKNQ